MRYVYQDSAADLIVLTQADAISDGTRCPQQKRQKADARTNPRTLGSATAYMLVVVLVVVIVEVIIIMGILLTGQALSTDLLR